MRLLDAGGTQVVEDHLLERLRRTARLLVLDLERIDQLVVLVHAERAVRAEALDGERAGDADGLRVDVGAVVEVLELRLGRDRRVDRLLPGDARLPEVGERLLRSLRPVRWRLARDFPFDERRCRNDLAARHRERRVGRCVEADVLAFAPARRHAERRLVAAQRRIQPSSAAWTFGWCSS